MLFQASCLYLHLGFCLNPHLRPARERFVRTVDHGAWAVDRDPIALSIFFVGLDRQYGHLGAFCVGADVVLINVDSCFHFCPNLR